MQFSFILIDESDYLETTLVQIKEFDDFLCVALCKTKTDSINKILELKPDIVFLSITRSHPNENSISFSLLI